MASKDTKGAKGRKRTSQSREKTSDPSPPEENLKAKKHTESPNRKHPPSKQMSEENRAKKGKISGAPDVKKSKEKSKLNRQSNESKDKLHHQSKEKKTPPKSGDLSSSGRNNNPATPLTNASRTPTPTSRTTTPTARTATPTPTTPSSVPSEPVIPHLPANRTPIIGTLDQKAYKVSDIQSSDKDTCDVSSASGSRSIFPPATMNRPSVLDRYNRRIVFVSAAESDSTGLTKAGEEMLGHVVAALKPVSIYFTAVIVAPTVPCLRTARVITNLLGEDSVVRSHLYVEPGLLDAYVQNKAIIDDERPFLLADAPSSTALTPARGTQEPTKLVERHGGYLPFTSRADVRAEKSLQAFESRVHDAIHHVVISQRTGCLLVILDPAPLDAAIRSLIKLPRLTSRDYSAIVTGVQNHPPAVPSSCVAIVDQLRLGDTSWELRHRFDPIISASGAPREIDLVHLTRKV